MTARSRTAPSERRTSSLAAAIASNTSTQMLGSRCTVPIFIDSITDAAIRADLEVALTNPTVASTTLVRALRAINLPNVPGPSTLQRHRRGDCRCGRSSA